jgi:hypothetical protein
MTEMTVFEKNIIKYLIVLLGMFVLTFLSSAFLPMLIRNWDFINYWDISILVNYTIPGYLIKIGFGVILYFDCRKEITHYYLIPILGIIFPVIGLVFYFVERLLLNLNDTHD